MLKSELLMFQVSNVSNWEITETPSQHSLAKETQSLRRIGLQKHPSLQVCKLFPCRMLCQWVCLAPKVSSQGQSPIETVRGLSLGSRPRCKSRALSSFGTRMDKETGPMSFPANQCNAWLSWTDLSPSGSSIGGLGRSMSISVLAQSMGEWPGIQHMEAFGNSSLSDRSCKNFNQSPPNPTHANETIYIYIICYRTAGAPSPPQWSWSPPPPVVWCGGMVVVNH